MVDVDEYYDSIVAYFTVHETEAGSQMISIKDLSGRWQRALSTGGVTIASPDPVRRRRLPRAVARLRP